ncbi:sodium pump decarboxylase subunit gamma [Treponema phagedenis]|uniref:Oxaloacetate decarboxylase gamma chain n=1 Tax=Treponema phagedenis TaxID=162 RepID=A0A0B7GVH8_TREPH|nr:OadG family transporter subunit [Treponema phagedenis]EFW39344.1 sodium pump decarboxylase, gamma subunit [Treponema phagedenis F0421]NVP23197.1 OadG family protein [Treponema phagedenis]QEJ94810.1 sodium pump decarboxylase subunit gamma [Treponema phagedenis]QEJ97996.1 sodium pump decarboxylase subunit gamma [Treponema phagedenis]QEK00715.1 sodium pump decarboxylase subunit gamma [Treponema phagedenis]
MTIAEMIAQSGMLTVIGMGIVFVFLAILVFAVIGVNKLVSAFGWDKEEPAPAAPAVSAAPTNTTIPAASTNDSVIAAIAVAIHEQQNN